MATYTQMSRFAPKPTGIRDPRDAKKKNGMFFNPVRYLYFGGCQQDFTQAGDKAPHLDGMASPTAVGPISDRGKGRG